MKPERWDKLESVFFGALDCPSEERGAYLDRACAGDPELRAEVDAVLAAHGREGGSQPLDRLLALQQPAPDAPDRAGMRIGPYRLEALIGRGGMGEVYRAVREDAYRQEVAVKLIRPGLHGAEMGRRLRVERQILARLEHPNIATLLDGGVTDNGQPYLVMQYVRGVPITEYANVRHLSVEDRLRLFATVCEAVLFAHANLVVHRDLKPSNILVTEEGQARLLDFGIAKLMDPEVAGVTTVVSTEDLLLLTPDHAAPEQLLGAPVTTATDVYALGVLLYELLTGVRPFHDVPPIERSRAVCEREPRRPSAVVGQRRALVQRLRGDLDHIVLMALRKEPERRYASAGQLAEDVGRHLQGRPVIARPDTVGYRARKFVNRNRLAVVGVAGVAVVLAGATVVTANESRQRARALTQVEAERDKAARLSEFMLGVFRASEPGEARGRTVTARELLDRAAEQLDEELADQPLVRADMETAVGRAYSALGLFDPARTLFEAALRHRLEELPRDHADVAAAMELVARAHATQGRLDEAVRMSDEALRIHERAFGSRHPKIADHLALIARIRIELGQYDTARVLLERARAIQREAKDVDGRSLANTLRNLGLVATWKDDHDTALAWYREALATARAALGDDDPWVYNLYEDVGLGFAGTGQTDSAIAVARHALAGRERLLGPEHVDVSYSLHNLGRFLARAGRHEEAAPLYRRAIEIRERALGPDHAAVGYVTHSYANVHIQNGDLAAAGDLFTRTLAIHRAALGEEHLSTNDAREGLAIVRTLEGRFDEAIGILESAVDHGYDNLSRLGEPPFDRLTDDPRFQRLAARVRERVGTR